MMRAMAILYIGPDAKPDFQTDYYLSPILAPDSLLSKFPPMLMTCGEKDPFVDDTVIFAGRVREAKRTRKQELERSAGGHKGVRFGENLRMSAAQAGRPIETAEQRLLNENEEDWVQMEILEGWSHGYLQMPPLLREALTAIDHLADWMNETFSTHVAKSGSLPQQQRMRGHKKYQGYSADLGGVPLASETETDRDEVLTFVPKKKRSPPPSGSRHGSVDNTTAKPLISNGPASLSSDETLGPVTPLSSTPISSPVIGIIGGHTPLGGNRGREPRMLGAELLVTEVSGKGVQPLISRSGTPTKAALLSETELMRRRMVDVVSGMGDNPAESEAGSSATP